MTAGYVDNIGHRMYTHIGGFRPKEWVFEGLGLLGLLRLTAVKPRNRNHSGFGWGSQKCTNSA